MPPPPSSSLPRRSRVLPGRGHGGSGGAHPVSPLGVPPPVPGCSPREPPGGAFRPRPVPQAHPAAPGAAGDPSAPSAPSASCCSLEHPSAPRAPNAPGGPSASCCSRGSSCSRCIPVLPVHLSPSHWSLVLPSQGRWQGHSTQQHSSPIPTLTPQTTHPPRLSHGKPPGRAKFRAGLSQSPTTVPGGPGGVAAMGLIPEVAGQQWDVGYCQQEGGYEGDGSTSGQGCARCWRCAAGQGSCRRPWTSPLLSGPVAPSSPAPSWLLGLGASDPSRLPP